MPFPLNEIPVISPPEGEGCIYVDKSRLSFEEYSVVSAALLV